MDNIFDTLQYFKLELTYDDKVLIVTLNRPPVNAFIKESYMELSSIIAYVHASDTICAVILKSDGRMFSAGADVKRLADDTLQEAAVRRSVLRKAGGDLYTCPVPVISAVNGAVIGAGAGFASYGDIIIAMEDAFFAIPEINVGVVGGAIDLKRLLPPQKIRSLALTGRRISAREIYQYGGIEAIVESREELLEKALEYAQEISDKGFLAVRKWKESLLAIENAGLNEGTYIEQCLSQELSLHSPKPIVNKN